MDFNLTGSLLAKNPNVKPQQNHRLDSDQSSEQNIFSLSTLLCSIKLEQQIIISFLCTFELIRSLVSQSSFGVFREEEEQECIPVGCIWPACRPYVWWLPLGVSSRGDGYPRPGHTHASEGTWYQRYPLEGTWDQGYPPMWADRHL